MNSMKQEETSGNETSSIATTSTVSSQKSKKKRKRGPKNKIQKIEDNSDSPYKCTTWLTQSRTVIYGIAFNHFIKNRNIFATASGNQISVYECILSSMKLLRVYTEPDKAESFYCICWGYKNNYRSAEPILAAAGAKGVIRVINYNSMNNFVNLIGHTGAINDLKFHPVNSELLLSASKDYSIRLWNIKKSSCLANFSGVGGHRDEVLSIDISVDGKSFISGGIDNCIKIWPLNVQELQNKIDSNNNDVVTDTKNYQTAVRIYEPAFSTREVHTNYVDSVKFFGNLLFSKSCEDEIALWQYDKNARLKGSGAKTIFTFNITECEMFFIRMELNLQMTQLAVGSDRGKIFVFDLDTDVPVDSYSTLTHSKCLNCVRNLAFSKSGDILVAACDDGTIWRWDRREKKEKV